MNVGNDLKCLYLTSRAGDRVLACVAPGFAVDLKALAAALGLPRLSVAGARTVRDELGVAPAALGPEAVIVRGDPSVVFAIDSALKACREGVVASLTACGGFAVHVCDIAAPARARGELPCRRDG